VPADVYIGTAGWHYKHWKGPFYPPKLPGKKMLDFYAERFRTVEINSSFYRLPLESGLDNWRECTPPDFHFAVKGSRFLTHMKKLKDPGPGIEKFFERIDRLETKLGPVIFQLPPWWEVNSERLETFLEMLPPGNRYAFELRNETWRSPAIYEILRRHNTAFCIFEIAGTFSGLAVTADFTYVRLHGPGGAYQGSYPDETLQMWAGRIREWSKQLKAVYVYFDNDQAAYAVENALTLEEMLRV